MPELLSILRTGDEREIEIYIRSFGSAKGMLVAALLQAIQVLTVFFPAPAVQVAAGILFGWWKGTLICLATFLGVNFSLFLAARKLGARLGALIERADGKGEKKLRFITESDSPVFMILLAYMMPFLPNGLIPYIAARTPVSARRFFLAMLAGSAPSILLFCAIGNRVLQQDFRFVAILCGGAIVAVVSLFVFRKRIVELARRLSATHRQ